MAMIWNTQIRSNSDLKSVLLAAAVVLGGSCSASAQDLAPAVANPAAPKRSPNAAISGSSQKAARKTAAVVGSTQKKALLVANNSPIGPKPEPPRAENSILQATEEGFDFVPGLIDSISNGFVDPKVNMVSPENVSLSTCASLDLVTGPNSIDLVTEGGSLLASFDSAMSEGRGDSLITSPPLMLSGRVVDDSYIMATTGSRMLDSLTVCATPALAGAFAAIPSGCAVQPIVASEQVTFKEGTAVVVADRDMEIAVNVGKLKVAEGSVVLVSNTENGTAIYDFHDPGKNSVLLTVAGRSIAISPGRHLHATSEKNNKFAMCNLLDRISHRNLVTSATESGITVFTSEFSTLAALEAIEPLKAVLTHKHPEARKLANQMIKTSAVLMQLGSNGEEFKYHFKPKMTALVNGAEVAN